MTTAAFLKTDSRTVKHTEQRKVSDSLPHLIHELVEGRGRLHHTALRAGDAGRGLLGRQKHVHRVVARLVDVEVSADLGVDLFVQVGTQLAARHVHDQPRGTASGGKCWSKTIDVGEMRLVEVTLVLIGHTS